MPALRKLTEDEVKEAESVKGESSRVVTARFYDELLAEFDLGSYGEIALDEGDKKPTVKANVIKAFNRRDLGVQWRRGKENSLKFHVVELNSGTTDTSGE